MNADRESRAALFDFLEQWREDGHGVAQGGEPRPLAEYLRRFPDHQDAVAREYLRLTAEGSGADQPPESPESKLRAESRYVLQGEIARGGMGRVQRVRDEGLERDLAMKVALRGGSSALARFEKEARITGQLDHPGVVPVHALGSDADGHPFFTMRLISGRDLSDIIQLVHSGDEDWTLARALGVLLRVCDTLAFAHARGVVHRDLKPANVRVGKFGEVYVMDWGLARASGEPELNDLRLCVAPGGPADGEREPAVGRESRDTPSASPLITMDGDVIGTPCAMPPEQAAGRVEELGPRSDVYSAGAMLYELLSGAMPYVARGERLAPALVLTRVLAGPPTPLRALCPDAPAELVAICDKAMARDPADRYADMQGMAGDLRAYLEGRVVGAYQTGLLEALRKWVARNRALALAIGSALLIALSALVSTTVLLAAGRERLQLLADSRAPADLLVRFEGLASGRPEDAGVMERWLAEARELVGRHDAHVRKLEGLRARALPWDLSAPAEAAVERARRSKLAEIDKLEAYYRGEEQRLRREGGLSEEGMTREGVVNRLKSLDSTRPQFMRPPERLTWTFASPRDQVRHDALAKVVTELEPFLDTDEADGLVTLAQRRLDFARTVEQRTLRDAAEEWQAAIDSIADRERCPLYAGLLIRPQLGLVPLRRDPRSGLWEFLHLESGDAPEIDADGNLRLEEESGVVLVLLPGGTFELGAQSADPEGANYDPWARPLESARGPEGPTTVRAILAPFFLSKYELTQAQWRRCAGCNPSRYTPSTRPAEVGSLLHPVETVSWEDCVRQLSAVGLTLPTEAQWEYGARAGTATPWWTGADRDSLLGACNLADSRGRGLISADEVADWPELDDGYPLHAPVGSYRPNAFGLHDVNGNVAEWCLDAAHTSYDHPTEVRIDTFERLGGGEGLHVLRGGSYLLRATSSRSAARTFFGPEALHPDVGLRPARALER